MKINLKRPVFWAAVFIAVLALSGCSVKSQLMDQPAADNNYHYKNPELGFSLTLPPEFIYYQTQRKKIDGAVELAIFVPTSDTAYPQEVSGYAKPISVKIYEEKDWTKLSDEEKAGLNKIGQKGDRIYVLTFWEKTPADWLNKWSEAMKEKITGDFRME